MEGKVEFYKETEFKDTEIGRTPKDWEAKKIKNIVVYKKGVKPEQLDIKRVDDNYLPYLTAEYLRGQSEPKYVNSNEERLVIAQKDDILMIWDGSNAGDIFTGTSGTVASTFVRITCNKNIVCPEYLYYYLLGKVNILKDRTKGTGIPHINRDTFENLQVPLIPLEEQQKIVEILLTLDYKIQILKQEENKLQKIKQWFMDHLLTGRIRVRIA